MKTLLCLIIDRSGSMTGKEEDVVGGVNNFITDQQKLPDPAVIELIRFDHEYDVFQPACDLKDAQPLKREDYIPRGSTALLDAVGRTLGSLDEVWAKHQPDRAIVVIITDGHENASREFTKSKIKAMIETREASGKWAFLYFGADAAAFAEAGGIGISMTNTASYSNTSIGTQSAYGAMGQSVTNMRRTGSTNANLGGAVPETLQPTSWTPPDAA
jgi:hypothetical protein